MKRGSLMKLMFTPRVFYEIKDSLQDLEKAKKMAELEVRYEQKKGTCYPLLERDNKIQMLWSNILIAVLILVGILSVALYYLQHYRDRRNRLILNLEIEQLTSPEPGAFRKIQECVDERK